MEIKRRVLIVVIVLEAFFTTLSNGLGEYLISCSEHTMLSVKSLGLSWLSGTFICMLVEDSLNKIPFYQKNN